MAAPRNLSFILRKARTTLESLYARRPDTRSVADLRALRELRDRLPDIPLIVDAGLGLPSHACKVMEWGFDGVLINTAVSRAIDPVRMAIAFAAVEAGRSAYLAGPFPVQERAVPSTPEIGKPFWY